MILDDVLKRRPEDDLEAARSVLRSAGIRLVEGIDRLSVSDLDRMISYEREKLERLASQGPLYRNKGYGKAVVRLQALNEQRKLRQRRESSRIIERDATYYRDVVRRADGTISGLRCYVSKSGRASVWSRFVANEGKMKILEVLRSGGDEDFSRIYYDLADGEPLAAAREPSYDHVIRSSPKAMRAMIAYCDRHWVGAWPWEVKAPERLAILAEKRENQVRGSVRLARRHFDRLAVRLREGEIEKGEVIIRAKELVDKVDNLIDDLAKISADATTTFQDEARTSFGVEVAQSMARVVGDKMNAAVGAIGDLKAELTNKIKEFEGQVAGGMGGGMIDMPDNDLGGMPSGVADEIGADMGPGLDGSTDDLGDGGMGSDSGGMDLGGDDLDLGADEDEGGMDLGDEGEEGEEKPETKKRKPARSERKKKVDEWHLSIIHSKEWKEGYAAAKAVGGWEHLYLDANPYAGFVLNEPEEEKKERFKKAERWEQGTYAYNRDRDRKAVSRNK